MRVTQMPAGGRGNVQKVYLSNQVMPAGTNGKKFNPGNFLAGLEKDDYILAGIILVLVLEGCDDYILLAALGYLLFMGIKG